MNKKEALEAFQLEGKVISAERYGSGHINDTFCAVFDQGACRVRYNLQRVNSYIFKNPEGLMDNFVLVCD